MGDNVLDSILNAGRRMNTYGVVIPRFNDFTNLSLLYPVEIGIVGASFDDCNLSIDRRVRKN